MIMIDTYKIFEQSSSHSWKLVIAASLLLSLAGCGKDSGDGTIANGLQLPTDTLLNLYCADIGIGSNRCVLDDPENPYARTPFVTLDPTDENEFNTAKFALAEAAPSPKAKFYVYATALARAPTGENQWYTARALHELFTASESELIKEQTIRAYRAVLDNFLGQATFFEANFLGSPPEGGLFYPVLVANLTAADLANTPGGFTPLFDPDDAANNEFAARESMGGWGYTWAGMFDGPGGPLSVSGPVTRN
jgi:hypothetical protein